MAWRTALRPVPRLTPMLGMIRILEPPDTDRITAMKHAIVPFMLILLAGCNARDEAGVVGHGMKWSIAQRELEQNSWLSTLASSSLGARGPGQGGKAYRYLSPTGETVDIVTETVGDIEKVYRIFDISGKELDSITYR